MAVRRQLMEEHKELPRLERYEVLDRINSIQGRYALRDRAFVAFLYLSACRVEEVVKYLREKPFQKAKRKAEEQYKGQEKIRVELGKPLQKKQIDVLDDCVVVQGVRSLKRRDEHRRSIPIVVNDREEPFVQFFLKYFDTLDPEEYLFPITRGRAYQILARIGLFNHYMRHLRNTILVVEYGFSGQELQQFNGWTKSVSGDPYVHLGVENLLDKMRR